MPSVWLTTEDEHPFRGTSRKAHQGDGVRPMAQSSTTDHDKWVMQLEQLTKDRQGQYVTIEILHPAFGDEPEA